LALKMRIGSSTRLRALEAMDTLSGVIW